MNTSIEVQGLTKRYGGTVAVDGLSFAVRPGIVTGFVGPNGAGKSTTIRLILGLDAPDTGSATINGIPYSKIDSPLRAVGVLLDAAAVHPGRSAYDHLLWLAHSNGLPRGRVDEVLDTVGLTDSAAPSCRGFSLGMRQRLGIAAALLGDPPILMLDEPVNGLDPEGIRWIRGFLRSLAAEGRTVFVSSHLMSELEDTAHHLVVIGRGRLIADTSVDELLTSASGNRVVHPHSRRSRGHEPACGSGGHGDIHRSRHTGGSRTRGGPHRRPDRRPRAAPLRVVTSASLARGCVHGTD